ncbi:hypothetical protein GCM10022224_055760 [Nonomuraea antimicrobica]|uniref:Uncharacterized protein n=1 Tax=Nonomuraea antimicrobica TaxID=561173 RepID=A0ABP7CBQ7_9ACTN
MAIARSRGRLKGRAPKLTTRQQAELVRMYATGNYTIAELMEVFSVTEAEHVDLLQAAGFADVRITRTHAAGGGLHSAIVQARKA